MKEFILLIIFGLTISLTSGGCGNKSEVSGDKKDPSTQENKKESKDPSGDKKESAENKTDPNTQTEASKETALQNELGMKPGMPADFPADVPQPKNAKVIGSLTSTDGTMVTFESPEKVQDIITVYKEEMKKNGYVVAEDGESITPDKGGLINWKKNGKEVQLVLGFDKDKNISSLVITYK